MNTLAYLIYLSITYLVTVHVGFIFYRNGRLYILRLLHGDERLTQFINKTLLVGYYLVNLGYAALMISGWEEVTTWEGLVGSIGAMTGKILLTLAIMHFMNMAAIVLVSFRHQKTVNHKN